MNEASVSASVSRRSQMQRQTAGLLDGDEPGPFVSINPEGMAPGVIVCDHASNAVPRSLDCLGLSDNTLDRHIAYDIGAAGVAARLSESLDMPAVLAGYSRLVIDLNRPVDDFTCIREISDGVVIPGNRRLPDDARRLRESALHETYHGEVARAITAKRRHVDAPAIVSVHSCTDQMRGRKRPWHIGVLFNEDDRLSASVIRLLRAQNPDLTIGENQPYSGLDAYGFTIETHALPAGLPNVLFEVRQDMIADPAGQKRFADILARALAPALAEPGQLCLFRPLSSERSHP